MCQNVSFIVKTNSSIFNLGSLFRTCTALPPGGPQTNYKGRRNIPMLRLTVRTLRTPSSNVLHIIH